MNHVHLEAIEPLAMETSEFWKLIDHGVASSGLVSLTGSVNKLNWKELLAYDIQLRFVLLEGLSTVLGGAVPTENDIKVLVPRLVPILLQGRTTWSQLSKALIDDRALAERTVDLDAFFTHVERAYINNFLLGSGILRTNPSAVTNGILDFKLLTRMDPWEELRN